MPDFAKIRTMMEWQRDTLLLVWRTKESYVSHYSVWTIHARAQRKGIETSRQGKGMVQ